jgi:CYTH domain-containing protein
VSTYRVQVTVDVTTEDEQDVVAVESELAEAIGKIDGHPEWIGVEVELMDSGYELLDEDA